MKFVLLEWIGTETRFFSILSSAARPREVGQFSRSKVGHFSTLADIVSVWLSGRVTVVARPSTS